MGQGTGALGTSLLAQYGPAPTKLIWWLLLGASLAAAAAGIFVMPEPGARRPGVLASLRPHVGVPRQARVAFVVATPCLIAAWGLCGFYLSLGPSLAVQVIGSPNLVWGGLVIFLLTGVAAAAAVASADIPAGRAMLAGCLVLFAGVAITFGADRHRHRRRLPDRYRSGGRRLRAGVPGRLPHGDRAGRRPASALVSSPPSLS